MSDDPDLGDIEEILVSLVSAALTAAQTDAAEPDSKIFFHPDWEPTPRTRKSARAQQSSSWLRDFILSNLPAGVSEPLLSQQDQPPPPAPAASESSAHPHPSQPQPQPQPQLQEGAVAKLLEENRHAFEELINHPFPRALGDGTASLDGFRYYMIQDTLYLQTCARLKMSAVSRSLKWEDIENFVPRHLSSLNYVTESKKTLISVLGVPETTIKDTPRSEAVQASEKYYMDSVRDEDAFFAYYIVLLPCILSYWEIADRLIKSKSTVRNAIFHSAWTEVNYDSSSANKYIKFINANIQKQKGGAERWNDIFKTACGLECNIFNTGLRHPTPFKIVPTGTYSIQGSSAAEKVVLAHQNVESFLRSPSDKHLRAYFPSDAGLSVIGINKTGADNEKWQVAVTKNGYTFQNVGTGRYLGIATELNGEGRLLQAVVQPCYWWINPIQSELSQRSQLYQIYESKNLRYTLHANIEVLNRGGPTPITSHENFKRPHQMWSFELGGQSEQPDVADNTTNKEETKQEPHKEAQKDNDKKGARKEEVAERIAKLVEKFAQVLRKKERNETGQKPQKEAQKERNEETRQGPQKEAQKDGEKIDASNDVAKRMAELVKKYMQMLRGEFEVSNQLEKERNEEMRQELLKEARKDTNKEEVTKLFQKYERMLLEEFEAAEQLRKERTEKMRRELLRGARKDVEKMGANEEVTKKMAELFEKCERTLQEEFEAIEQLRKERNEKMRQELLKESRKGMGKTNAKLVEKYEQRLREDFEAVGQLRKERNDEMMQELVKEARQVIDKIVASIEVDKKMAKKYERMLQEGFEAIEQLRKERSVELRQELLEEARKGINKTDPIREGAKKMAGLAEKYEQRLQEEFEGIEQLRTGRNETTEQELLKEARKAIDKMDARMAKKMTESFEKYEQTLQEEFEAIEQLRKERNENMRQGLLKESRKGTGKTNAKMAELVETYERMLQKEFEAIGELRKECHEEAGQKLLEEMKNQRKI